jgi:hypothetical protein
VCTYVFIYVCMYVCMSVCTYVRMYVFMYVYMYVCMYVCIYNINTVTMVTFKPKIKIRIFSAIHFVFKS